MIVSHVTCAASSTVPDCPLPCVIVAGPPSVATVDVVGEVESWRRVNGYWYKYLVSSFGRVLNLRTGKLLARTVTRDGYLKVGLHAFKKWKSRLVHRIVASAFWGSCPKGYEVHHLDQDRCNAAACNLVYVPRAAHRRIHRKGRKLDWPKVAELRKQHREGATTRELVTRFGVSKQMVSFIVRGKYWAPMAA